MNPKESEHQLHQAEKQIHTLDFSKIAPPITPESEKRLNPDTKALGYLFNMLQIARHLFNSSKLGGEPREILAEALQKTHLNLLTESQRKMGVKTNFDEMLNVIAKINLEEVFQNPIDWNKENPTTGVKESLDTIDAHLAAEHDDRHWDFLLETRPLALEGIGSRNTFDQLYSRKLKGLQKLAVTSRVSSYAAGIQNLIEALPKEANLPQITEQELEVASAAFHESLKKLYEAYQISYQEVRLYKDTLSSPQLKQFLIDSRAAYKSDMSTSISKIYPALPHGIIVRIVRPVTKKHAETGENPQKWKGAIEYLERL